MQKSRRKSALRSVGGTLSSHRREAVEPLEKRLLLSATVAALHAHRPQLTDAVPGAIAYTPAGSTQPYTATAPAGLTPTQIRHAYGMDQVMFGAVAGNGAGQTIAIIDAYDTPNIATELQQFDTQFNLPAPPSFSRVNEYGGTTYPATGSWSLETSLDVEWAHVMAPQANLLLVEANSASDADLIQQAANWARSQPSVSAVSMSFGGGEGSYETSLDSIFTTPSGHAGVTFLASTGDTAAPAGYPSYSPNVVAVGGTLLNVDGSGNYSSESGWTESGGGISGWTTTSGATGYEPQPAYQKGVVTQSTTRRTVPDISMDADPNSGVAVYDSFDYPSTPWVQVGGTSLAAPLWAGVIAVANQGRARNGMASMDGPGYTLPTLYKLPTTDFHDITSGTSVGSPHYSATSGYDLVTGRGTPILNKLVYDLAGIPTTAPLTVTGTSSNDTIYVKEVGTTLDEWINAATPGQGTPTRTASMGNVSSLTIQGAGGNDSIIIDETGADLLATPTSVASTGGTVSLELIGSPNADSVFIHGDTNVITFNSDTLTFSNVTALTFWDTAGGDTVETAAASIPSTLDLTDNDNIILDSGNITINIQPAGTQPTFTSTTATSTGSSSGSTTASGGTATTTTSGKHNRHPKHGGVFSNVAVPWGDELRDLA